MKIYIATKYQNKTTAERVADELRQLGHQVTSTWHSLADSDAAVSEAIRDRADLQESNAVLVITKDVVGGRGMYWEMGWADAKGYEVYVLGPDPKTEEHPCVFMLLPWVRVIQSLSEIDAQVWTKTL